MDAPNQLHPRASAPETRRASFLVTNAWALLPVQVFLTGLITYAAIATATLIAGAYTEGLQVVGFAFFSAVLTTLVFLVGLPLRIAPSARGWWFRHAGWPLALFGLAAAAVVLSFFVGDAGPVRYTEADWPLTDGYESDARLFYAALIVLAFATMHLRPLLRRSNDQGHRPPAG